MNHRDDRVYLNDILESIGIIGTFIGDLTEFEFSSNQLVHDAVIRRFEIIGEAASKISDNLKIGSPQIEWGLMKDMRNKLIHEYFGVSAITIYQTIKADLPVLKKQIDCFSPDLHLFWCNSFAPVIVLFPLRD
jgi:uncharacterized protein with HEPN domain